ncbi:MAG: hypothetical protein AB8F78_05165 [Saprospiraceae bacterium]
MAQYTKSYDSGKPIYPNNGRAVSFAEWKYLTVIKPKDDADIAGNVMLGFLGIFTMSQYTSVFQGDVLDSYILMIQSRFPKLYARVTRPQPVPFKREGFLNAYIGGTMGSGKSTFATEFLNDLCKEPDFHNATVVAFDIKRDLVDYLGKSTAREIWYYSTSLYSDRKFSYNPLADIDTSSVLAVNNTVSAFESILKEKIEPAQVDIFNPIVRLVSSHNGTFRDVRHILDINGTDLTPIQTKWMLRGREYKHNIEVRDFFQRYPKNVHQSSKQSLLRKVRGAIMSPTFATLTCRSSTVSTKEIIDSKKTVLFDMNHGPDPDAHNQFCAFMLTGLCNALLKRKPNSATFTNDPVVLVLDEAHFYLNYPLAQTMFSQLRSRGGYVVCLSQILKGRFPDNVADEVNTVTHKFIGRSESKELGFLLGDKSLDSPDRYEFYAKQGVGELELFKSTGKYINASRDYVEEMKNKHHYTPIVEEEVDPPLKPFDWDE